MKEKGRSESKENNEQNIKQVKESKQRPKKLWVFLGIIFALALGLTITGLIGGWNSIKTVFDFVSDQVLGMKWLNSLIGLAFMGIFGQSFMNTVWGSAVQFFVYDTIKIIFLLCLLIFVISYIQSYYPPERTKKILGRYKGIGANSMGAILGTVTPFCSCSSIPLFMGFTSAGLSSGVTFSFLISSPLVDLGALIILVSVFGFPIAFAYVIVGLILAVIGGTIIEKTGVGKNVREFVTQSANVEMEIAELTKKDRALFAKDKMFETFKKVWPYIFIGVGIGAAIHNFIPENLIHAVLGQDKWYSVIVATFIGTPMYADIFGTIPVAEALFAKGVGAGTILAFMMSVTALSLPSMIMLSKAIKPKLLFSFIAIIVTGIIIIGFVFNALNFLFI